MSKFSRVLRTAAVLTLATAVAAIPTSASSAPRMDPLDGASQRALDAVSAAGSPGAFAEIRAGDRVWTGASGVADLSNARPMRPHMRQRVGSVTKTFVATTVLQLVGEGRLGLDDPVGRWLPGLVTGDVGQRVTVRMLLNHTSGIGDIDDALLDSYASLERVRTTVYTPQELLAIGLGRPRTVEPGEAHSYSNTNYIALGLIIERVTGRSAADEVTRRIIRPLRLTDTYFPGRETVVRGAHPGAYFASTGTRNFVDTSMTWLWMAGDLVSTTADLNDFFTALLGGRLLRADLLAQMRTTVPFDPARPEAGGYGLGIYSIATRCGVVWGHDGGVIGHLTISWHVPVTGRQVTYAMNLSHYQLLPAPDPNPIDAAWQTFVMGALCAGSTAEATARATAAAYRPLPLPGQLRFPARP